MPITSLPVAFKDLVEAGRVLAVTGASGMLRLTIIQGSHLMYSFLLDPKDVDTLCMALKLEVHNEPGSARQMSPNRETGRLNGE